MKICFVAGSLIGVGGEQRVLVNILNSLSTYEGIEVSLLTRRKITEDNPYKISENVNILYDERLEKKKHQYLPGKLFIRFYQYIYQPKNLKLVEKLMFSKKEVRRFNQFFSGHDFDIIIGVAPYLSVLLTLMDLNAAKFGWLHSTFDRYFNTKHDYAWNEGDIYSYMFSKLDEYIVLTESAKSEYWKKTDKEPVKINNPLSFKSMRKSDQENNNLLFVGRIDYTTKGLNHLIEITKQLRDNKNEFKLTIVGDGPDMSRLKSDIEKHGLKEMVHIIGATDAVEKYYLDSSICVVPSSVEGFGLIVIEAMETGLPVVSFETEGPLEIIQDDINGYLIPKYDIELFSDKIEFLLDHPKVRKTMGHNATKRAKVYSLENISEEWISLFNKYAN